MTVSKHTNSFALSPDGPGSGTDQESKDQAILMELRKDLAAVTADFSKVVQKRLADAENVASQTLDGTNSLIRAHPLTAVAVAMVMGAAVARFIVPARQRSLQMHIPNWQMPSIPSIPASWMQTARELPSSVANSSAWSSFASLLERVVDQVSNLDPKAQLSPALDKAGSWLNGIRDSVATK